MSKLLSSIVLFALILIGCQSTTPTPQTQKVQQAKAFEGTTWKLVSFGLTRMAVPTKASITFNDGHYSGHGGCNGVGGGYKLEDNKLTLFAGFSTMMACPELDLEHKYMKYLSSVTEYNIEGDTLDLRSGGQILLRFKAQ